MCRNIKRLHNVAPPAVDAEVRDAALQFVRKISGTTRPSRANAEVFDRAVDEITAAAGRLLASMVAGAAPADREALAARARQRYRARASG